MDVVPIHSEPPLVVDAAEHQASAAPSPTVAVIPAFNEERFIASVVLATFDYVEHVIVVDDGSSDRTAHLAERAGATVIRMHRNGGKAKALMRGFACALSRDPGAIVCLDADAQHDPAEIPTVVAPIVSGQSDVVIGSRFLTGDNQAPAWRRIGQHTLNGITNALAGMHTSDSQSGFRAFSAAAARDLKLRSEGLGVESEMQFMFTDGDLRVAEVPIQASYRDGNKRNPLLHGLDVLDAILSLVARRRPLMFFGVPGVALGLSGILMGLFVVYRMDVTGELMVGTAILTAIFAVAGLLLGVTGILLHSLGYFVDRLSRDVQRRLPEPDHGEE